MDTQIVELAKHQADVCRIFGSASRILIIWALAEHEMTVSDLAAAIGASPQNTSQHLRILKSKGIVTSQQTGNSKYYALDSKQMRQACIFFYARCPKLLFSKTTNEMEVHHMSTIDLTAIQAAKVVDARGSACPGPLLEAKKGIGAVKVGEVLEIWSGDPRTKEDIPKWSQKIGHEFLGVLVADGYDRIFIKRLK